MAEMVCEAMEASVVLEGGINGLMVVVGGEEGREGGR
jgi:hypothetical protein